MAKVLVCVENDEVNGKDHIFYEKIWPDFIKRHHELWFTPCPHAWDHLTSGPLDILLMFVRSKQSCCWEVARQVRDEWSLPYPPPRPMMIIERCLEDFDEPELSELTAWLDHPDYANILTEIDENTRAYYMEPEYFGLYHAVSRTFNVPGRTLVGRMEGLLFHGEFDREQFEDQIAALFPGPRERWSWSFGRVSYHPILNLRFHTASPERAVPVVWSWGHKIWVVDSWNKFLQFIEDEQLQLADERDREDILAVFSYVQQRNIIREIHQPDLVTDWKRILLAGFAEIIKPPTYSKLVEEHQVRFWAIDGNSSGGNLEEWVLTQQGMKFDAQFWIRDENFDSKFKVDFEKLIWCFSCYGIPPSFTLP